MHQRQEKTKEKKHQGPEVSLKHCEKAKIYPQCESTKKQMSEHK